MLTVHMHQEPAPTSAAPTTAVRPSPSVRRTMFGCVAIAIGAVAFAGCTRSYDPSGSAEDLIETDFADQLELGPLTSDCEEPTEIEVGDTFSCTATTEDGRTVIVRTSLESPTRIFTWSTNVLIAGEVPSLEADAAAVLSPEVGVEIAPDDVDCGEESIVLDDADEVRCEITDTATGDVYELTATLTDFVREEGFQNRSYRIGDVLDR